MDVNPPSLLRTHDLILFVAEPYREVLPKWADCVDGLAWAVIRRDRASGGGVVAAGVRGRRRAERQAVDVNRRDIIRDVSPENLVSLSLTRSTNPGICRALDILSSNASSWFGQRAWGPSGSVGFELATGLPVITAASDLDMILRASQYLSAEEARSILAVLATLPCQVDCLVETDGGAVALADWAACRDRDVLFRTSTGPRLVRDPWRASRGSPKIDPA